MTAGGRPGPWLAKPTLPTGESLQVKHNAESVLDARHGESGPGLTVCDVDLRDRDEPVLGSTATAKRAT